MEMILILIAILIVAVVSIAALVYAVKAPYNGFDFFLGLVGSVGAVAALLSAIMYATMGWGWFASQYKAEIINDEYGTNYSAKQVYFASDVIDTVRELDRKRIEVNGDLFREEPDEPDGE